jgi:hypothetical protein
MNPIQAVIDQHRAGIPVHRLIGAIDEQIALWRKQASLSASTRIAAIYQHAVADLEQWRAELLAGRVH